VKEELEFILVETVDEVLAAALESPVPGEMAAAAQPQPKA